VIKNDDPDAVAETILLECQQCLKHENDIRAIREAEIRQAAREQVRDAVSRKHRAATYAHAVVL